MEKTTNPINNKLLKELVQESTPTDRNGKALFIKDQGASSWQVQPTTALGPVIGGTTPFSSNTWETELRKRLDNRCIGYTYALTENGQVTKIGGGGSRRLSIDNGPLASSPYSVQHIASVSKNLTATLALRILDLYNVSRNAKIKNYLPSHWNIHDNVKDIKFKNLLRHKSGFEYTAAATSYPALKVSIEFGLADPTKRGNTRTYDNRNFGLFRILIPYIANKTYMQGQEVQGAAQGNLDEHLDKTCENLYEAWMRFLIMAPLGFYNVDTKYDGTKPGATLAYPFPYTPGTAGNAGPDYGPFSGGGGWVMSAYMLAKYLVFRRYDNSYLSASLRQTMDTYEMGWDSAFGANETKYLAHGGSFTNSGPLDTAIIQYPGNKEAVLLVNSNIVNLNTGNTLRAKKILVKAYEKTVGII